MEYHLDINSNFIFYLAMDSIQPDLTSPDYTLNQWMNIWFDAVKNSEEILTYLYGDEAEEDEEDEEWNE